MSPNVINLSKRNLTKDKIFLVSKGLQFFPTPKYFNKELLGEELEKFGWKLRLKWFFGMMDVSLTLGLLNNSPSLILEKNEAAIEFYLS